MFNPFNSSGQLQLSSQTVVRERVDHSINYFSGVWYLHRRQSRLFRLSNMIPFLDHRAQPRTRRRVNDRNGPKNNLKRGADRTRSRSRRMRVQDLGQADIHGLVFRLLGAGPSHLYRLALIFTSCFRRSTTLQPARREGRRRALPWSFSVCPVPSVIDDSSECM